MQNADHADHYTAANASHIRILLREDNLGLGAQLGKGNAETFGLSLFSGVLGRLNGKSDAEVEKQQGAIRDAELRNYHATKFGLMNFVSGGLLVGDTIQPAKRNEAIFKVESNRNSKKESKGEKSKKSKPVHMPSKQDEPSGERHERTYSKQDSSAEVSASDSSRDVVHDGDEKIAKKHRKRDRNEHDNGESSTPAVGANPPLSKSERRERKEKRRKRKEEKLREKSSKEPLSTDPRLVRKRYIDQKRMASRDPQAMKEIFMLTGTA